VDKVTVCDREIRTSGPKSALVGAMASNQTGTHDGVPSFDREWWAGKDKTGHWSLVVIIQTDDICF
jgi:hypothetical protein